MANIIITNQCNLRCKYCFAEDILNQPSNFIKHEDFIEILAWLGQNKKYQEQIGIIGGEPTLHPMFQTIIKTLSDYCETYGTDALIFTNGIHLKKYLKSLGDNIGILINCNSPESMGTPNYQKMLDTIYTANKLKMIENDKIRCGCNLHLLEEDYSYFWNDIVDKINPKFIRCSVVSPGGCYAKEWQHQNKKEEYYSKLKPIFMNFMQEACKRNIIVGLDCNQIPICYFSEKEQNELIPLMEYPPYSVCRPAVDIYPDLSVTSCFGSQSQMNNKLFLNNFKDIREVRECLFVTQNAHKASLNNGGKCKNCQYYNEMQCQGGCLSFAKGSN